MPAETKDIRTIINKNCNISISIVSNSCDVIANESKANDSCELNANESKVNEQMKGNNDLLFVRRYSIAKSHFYAVVVAAAVAAFKMVLLFAHNCIWYNMKSNIIISNFLNFFLYIFTSSDPFRQKWRRLN